MVERRLPIRDNGREEVAGLSMMTRLIYLDTTIWNVLSEQAPGGEQARKLCSELDVNFTLGLNAYFEMLKSFFGKRSDAVDRGKRLFNCLRNYLENGVAFLKSWEELLVEEARRSSGEIFDISLFSDATWRGYFVQGAQELAKGKLRPELRQLIEKRDGQSRERRSMAERLMQSQPEMLQDLRMVDPVEIEGFLATASVGGSGQHLLAKHLTDVFKLMSRPVPMADQDMAAALLSSDSNRVSHAIVRNDIFQNWRAARARLACESDSVRVAKCIPDDSYHVVNGCYCDLFLTEDKDGQAVAAQYVAPRLKALVYQDKYGPFLDWLGDKLPEVG